MELEVAAATAAGGIQTTTQGIGGPYGAVIGGGPSVNHQHTGWGAQQAQQLQHTQERAQFEETQVGGMAPPPTHTFADGLSFSRFEVIHLCVHPQY
jgi:hypothetical protein